MQRLARGPEGGFGPSLMSPGLRPPPLLRSGPKPPSAPATGRCLLTRAVHIGLNWRRPRGSGPGAIRGAPRSTAAWGPDRRSGFVNMLGLGCSTTASLRRAEGVPSPPQAARTAGKSARSADRPSCARPAAPRPAPRHKPQPSARPETATGATAALPSRERRPQRFSASSAAHTAGWRRRWRCRCRPGRTCRRSGCSRRCPAPG